MCNYNVIYMYVHGYLLVHIQYYVLILSQYSIDSTTVSIIAIYNTYCIQFYVNERM